MNPFALVAGRRRRREARDADTAKLFARRRYLREDVTVFGEQLSELHLDSLTDVLDDEAQRHYRGALDAYEKAKASLAAAEDLTALEPVLTALVDGRHERACVLALAAGEPLPERWPECFFNPQHGPSSTEVAWTPPGGVERRVAVCRTDANRLAQGEAPALRMVRVGDRVVPLVVARDTDERFPTHVDGHLVRNQIAGVHGRAQLEGFPTNRSMGEQTAFFN